jgi:hypothetical protein
MTDKTISRESAQAVLNVPMDDEDSGAKSVRGYLVALLREVWREDEDFCGKRPFGNTGWKWGVYADLVKAGLVAGSCDGDGYLEHLGRDDRVFADRLIAAAIEELGRVES